MATYPTYMSLGEPLRKNPKGLKSKLTLLLISTFFETVLPALYLFLLPTLFLLLRPALKTLKWWWWCLLRWKLLGISFSYNNKLCFNVKQKASDASQLTTRDFTPYSFMIISQYALIAKYKYMQKRHYLKYPV